MIPSFDKQQCQTPIADCDDIVPREYQVINGDYGCTDCSVGLFWEDSEWACSGVCMSELPGCVDCEHDAKCNQCVDHMMVKPDDSGCQLKIDNCIDEDRATQPGNLYEMTSHWECANCESGYRWDAT